MKLIIQIPAYNERETLPAVLAELPRQIAGVDVVEVLVIDDGSNDGTSDIARQYGAHVVRNIARKGLPTTYQRGIDTALRLGADIIVNTDADGQYPGDAIAALLAPILRGEADIVVGDRQTDQLEHFTAQKKVLQKIGSAVVRRASGTEIPDTVSGFRALNREAALRTFVTTDFSYTIESLIQAGKRWRLVVTHIPITAHPTRPSRLHRGNWHFVKRQASTIVRTYATYEPLRTFFYLALPFLLVGLGFMGRATYVYLRRNLASVFGSYTADNTQALILGGVLLLIGFLIFLFGLLADRVSGNRRLLEELLYRQRRAELERMPHDP